jgi:hypothetical protein
MDAILPKLFLSGFCRKPGANQGSFILRLWAPIINPNKARKLELLHCSAFANHSFHLVS